MSLLKVCGTKQCYTPCTGAVATDLAFRARLDWFTER